MMRPGRNFVILDKDLNNGFVKIHNYKGIKEYWIYRNTVSSSLVNVVGKALETGKTYLHAIIACGDKPITLKVDNRIEINGLKFTNDIESRDLDDYLKKTNRGYNG